MEIPNVNKLNGIPNFGHGMPSDGVVIAGVTDVPQVTTKQNEEVISESEESNRGVQEGETSLGVEAGSESEIEEASDSDSSESGGLVEEVKEFIENII